MFFYPRPVRRNIRRRRNPDTRLQQLRRKILETYDPAIMYQYCSEVLRTIDKITGVATVGDKIWILSQSQPHHEDWTLDPDYLVLRSISPRSVLEGLILPSDPHGRTYRRYVYHRAFATQSMAYETAAHLIMTQVDFSTSAGSQRQFRRLWRQDDFEGIIRLWNSVPSRGIFEIQEYSLE